MKNKRCFIAILLAVIMIAGMSGCAGTVSSATDLMSGVTPESVTVRQADSAFIGSMADFSIDLFRQSITDGENSLISPLSVALALSMTANGADGETLAQMENLLGGGMELDVLNEYMYSYVAALPLGQLYPGFNRSAYRS
jgi:serpin B